MRARPLSRLIVLALLSSACAPLAAPGAGSEAPSAEAPSASEVVSKIPLSFIENRGQVPNQEVSHYAQTPAGGIGFTSSGLRIGLSDTQGTAQTWNLAMDFVGGRSTPQASERREGVVSYFTGNQKDWHTNLPTHARITYRDVWEGIDLIYRTDGPKLKYEFVVHPGADPSEIRLRWRGASRVSLQDGSLQVQTPAGSLSDAPPVSFQDGRTVETSYELTGATVGFRLGAYDPSRTLVIDPVLTLYAGYIGGSGSDIGNGIAVDPSGAAYVTGRTDSTAASFPETVGPSLAYSGGDDAFVAKVAPSGTALSYAGYIGGSGDDSGNGIAVDPSGAAYVTGRTNSTAASFPETVGPFLTNAGGDDAFVAKVAPSGTALSYAGYIGGTGTDVGTGLAVDSAGAAYVTGETNSTADAFPETVGPVLTHSGDYDAFVAKVAPSGTALSYAGYIGGSGEDGGTGIAVDPAGGAYVAGYTNSTAATFPETVGPYLAHSGNFDAFVAKVGPSGAALSYAGYIGGSGDEGGNGIAVDRAGAAYVAGYTSSTAATFPETVGPSLTNAGGYDAFVVKLGATDRCLGRTVTLLGSPGRDVLRGTTRADVILAGSGRDVIRGRGGADRLCGGRGKDRLLGGGGKDRLHGGPGRDTCDGGPKVDAYRSCETQS